MKRSKSSQQWLKRHFNDPYVIAAQKAGYRSRAAFKLLEMQEKDRLLIPGRVVVDLGATPGGWSQIAVPLVGKHGVVIALDVLVMEPLEGVTFLQGDFTEPAVLEQLLAAINGRQVDLVMSDMSPNISGMKVVDQPRTMYLAELALDFAKGVLKAKGDFVTKIFQGEGFDAYVKELRGYFEKVVIRKPKASRAESREVYIIAKGFKAHASQ